MSYNIPYETLAENIDQGSQGQQAYDQRKLSQKLTQNLDLKFNISKEQVDELFTTENLQNKTNYDLLKKIGGTSSLVQCLQSNIKNGIDNNPKQIAYRKKVFGANEPRELAKKSICTLISETYEDTMLRIITVAAIASLVIGILDDGIEKGWMEGVTILLAIIIIITVTVGNDYMKQKQFEKLAQKLECKDTEVFRNGQPLQVPVSELVVGDILVLNLGEIVPVDGIVVHGSGIIMDESAMTGEPKQIIKDVVTPHDQLKNDCFIMSGTKVINGYGQMIVTCIGESSVRGRLQKYISQDSEPTPLQQKLDIVAGDIGKYGTWIAGAVMAILLIYLVIDLVTGKQCFLCLDFLSEVLQPLLIAITIIVMAVPEGLPLAVVIALAYSVNKMKDEQNLVKRLAACEIMGGVNTICSDKTGTLTLNQMTTVALYFQKNVTASHSFYTLRNDFHNLELLSQIICVNSTANPKKGPNDNYEQIGNKTECALLQFINELGFDFQSIRNQNEIVFTYSFSSVTKRMTVIIKLNNYKYRVLVKGASELLISKCTHELVGKQSQSMTPSDQQQIVNTVINDFANKSYRTIGLAYKDINNSEFRKNETSDDYLVNNLTLVGIAGIQDPLRPETKHAIEQCKEAGIITRMVTGDNLNTAISIAKECGILGENYDPKRHKYVAMTGAEFWREIGEMQKDEFQDENQPPVLRVGNLDRFNEITQNLRVLARSTPEHKFALVAGLQELNNIVAVTGDGTNDVPAITKADIGFSMNISGTDIAKEAAGIILLDDNFKSIITACKWGRNIFDSVQKFLQFQLTINIVALFMAILGSLSLRASPLNAIQMLWVNLIMDTFAALALATEPPTEMLLKRRPYSKQDSIISSTMKRIICFQSLYQIAVLSFILFVVPSVFQIPNTAKFFADEFTPLKFKHFTIFFHTFVMMQIFNEFNSRKLLRKERNIFKNIFNNWIFWFIIMISVAVQVAIVQYGGNYINCAPLSLNEHIFCCSFGFGSLIITLIIKLIPNKVYNSCKVFREEQPIKEVPDQYALVSYLSRQSLAYRKKVSKTYTVSNISEIEDTMRQH